MNYNLMMNEFNKAKEYSINVEKKINEIQLKNTLIIQYNYKNKTKTFLHL
jgi:hypothetical protein